MKKLRDVHHKAIRLLVAGKTQTEVAQELLVHWTTVCVWMHDPLFLEEKEKRRKELEAIPLIDQIENPIETNRNTIEIKDSLETLTRSRDKQGRFRKKS